MPCAAAPSNIIVLGLCLTPLLQAQAPSTFFFFFSLLFSSSITSSKCEPTSSFKDNMKFLTLSANNIAKVASMDKAKAICKESVKCVSDNSS